MRINRTLVVVSRGNSLFKRLKKLSTSTRERTRSGTTVLDGARLVELYCRLVGAPKRFIVSEGAEAGDQVGKLLAAFPQVEISRLARGLFGEVTGLKNSSGILAEVSIPGVVKETAGKDGLLLEEIQDPGNIGTILRTAAAAGAGTVYLTQGCSDPWSPKALRAGMGGHFHLNLVQKRDPVKVMHDFRGTTVALTPEEGESVFHLDLQGPILFAIGNEGGGLSDEVFRAAARRALIPMPGWNESLNAATAAAVGLFEMVRQRASR